MRNTLTAEHTATKENTFEQTKHKQNEDKQNILKKKAWANWNI